VSSTDYKAPFCVFFSIPLLPHPSAVQSSSNARCSNPTKTGSTMSYI